MAEASALLVETYRRALESGDAGLLPVCFSREVLRKYLQAGGRAARTDNAGMLVAARFGVDFGIVDEAGIIHLTWGDFLSRVPAGERSHWLEHLVSAPVNPRFLRMRLRSACVNDGGIRPLVL